MDPQRLPGYLRGATEMQLATLAQEARNPAIIAAVQQEMNRRAGGSGGLSDADMTIQAPTESWVPPWQQPGGGQSPYMLDAQQAGPVPDMPTAGPGFEGAGRGSASMPGSPLLMDEQWEGPVAANPALASAGPAFEGAGRGAATMSPEAGPGFERSGRGAATVPGLPPLPEEDVGYPPGVGPIERGAAAGREAAFGQKDADLDIPPETIAIARKLEDAGDNPDVMQQLIAEIQGGIQSPEDMRRNALARGFFGMAASRNPYFFGALGEGAMAGLDDYEKSKQESLMNRIRAAEMQQGQQEFGEKKRATGVSEKQDETRLSLTEKELGLREKEYNRKVKEYDDGKATADELAKAEVALRQAQAKYYQERPRSTSKADLLTDDKGFLMRLTPEGGAEYVTDPEGKKVKGTKLGSSGATAEQRNVRYYADLLFGGDEAAAAAFVKSGKTMSPDVRRRTALSMAASAAAADPTLVDPAERQQFIDETAANIEADLESAAKENTPSLAAPEAAPAAPTSGGAEAPVYQTPEDVRADYQAGKLTKEQAKQYLQQFSAP